MSIAPSIAPYSFQIYQHGISYSIPMATSNNLNQPNSNILHAIILVHGILKDANSEYNNLMEIVPKKEKENYIVIAPQYLTEADINKFDLPNNTPAWNLEDWDEGSESIAQKNKQLVPLSSFTIIDGILQRLSNKYYFPKLHSVVLIGFSAGGQFIQRYAAANKMDEKLKYRNIKIIYIPISPSSYLYFSPARPTINENKFNNLSINEKKQCSIYDDYKYGMKALNPYFSKVGYKFVVNHYKERNIIYVVGKQDKERDFFLDKSCAADLQGRQRLARALNYFRYLHAFYSKSSEIKQSLIIINNASHNFQTLIKSPELKLYLFK